MNWIFLGIMVGAIAYLMMIVLSFVEEHRESRGRLEQTQIDIKRLEDQLSESEHARLEAEARTNSLEEEALEYESQISALHQKIKDAMPSEEKAS